MNFILYTGNKIKIQEFHIRILTKSNDLCLVVSHLITPRHLQILIQTP